MKKFWKYLRWVFPPFYLYLALLYLWRGVRWCGRKIVAGITWPFRKFIGLFSRKKKGRQFKSYEEGFIWATKFLNDSTRRRPMTLDYFRRIWRRDQESDSYIVHETIEAVAKDNDLTTEQLVFIMCHPSFEWTFSIHGWREILDHYGAWDRKGHTHFDLAGHSYSVRTAQRDWGEELWGLSR